MSDIIALETIYKNHKFRSRLECRWAIYFDHCGIKWEYEREAYNLGVLGNYLPDFWLPQVQLWAEVKPVQCTKFEYERCRALAKLTGRGVLLLEGPPEETMYWALEPKLSSDGELMLIDYHVSSQYLNENRFFMSASSCSYPQRERMQGEAKAVAAAMSARFDNGRYSP